MRYRAGIVALVIGLSVGCEAAPAPLVSSPPEDTPSLTSQADSAMGSDPRCVPTTGGDFAHRAYTAPLSVADAEVILICTTRFEFGGMPPKRQGQAFNVLFESPDAIARFQSIAAKGGPAGRLYALAALHVLAKPEADRVARDLALDRRQVRVQDSDVIVGTRVAADLVSLVQSRQIAEEFRRDRDAIATYFN